MKYLYYVPRRRRYAKAAAPFLSAAVVLVPYFWPEALAKVVEPFSQHTSTSAMAPAVYYRDCSRSHAAAPALDADLSGCERYRGS